MKLTDHQKRVLSSLLNLERRHVRRWWSREAIGCVVGAGGFHDVIQKRTMLTLSAASLVMLEVESWPKEVRRLVTCNCAAYRWGLTDAGRQAAEAIPIRMTDDAEKRLADAREYECQDPGEGQTTHGDRFVSSLDDEIDLAEFWKRA